MSIDSIGIKRDDFVNADSACAIDHVHDIEKNLQDLQRDGFPTEMSGLQQLP